MSPLTGSATSAAADAKPLSIESIVVHPDRLELLVRVAGKRWLRTTPELMGRVLESFPYVGYHACRNEVGPMFSAVMDCTSLPHLLEHLIVDLQVRAAERSINAEHDGCPQATFVGTTEFASNDPLLATVRVSFADDVVALACAKQACEFLNGLLLGPVD